jgi:hypothetical protein
MHVIPPRSSKNCLENLALSLSNFCAWRHGEPLKPHLILTRLSSDIQQISKILVATIRKPKSSKNAKLRRYHKIAQIGGDNELLQI